MHPELASVLSNLSNDQPAPDEIVLQSAEKLLSFMEDINLERTETFEFTPAESLYIKYNVGDWEFQMECLKNGKILYTFRKDNYGLGNGSLPVDRFIPRLQKYLLMII